MPKKDWTEDPKRLEMAAAAKKQEIADCEADIKAQKAALAASEKHLAELKK